MTTDHTTASQPLTLYIWLTFFFTFFSWAGELPILHA